MTRSSITKKALFISTCALLFSMLMMAGSTFAWFTDSVSTGSNKITTGSLKVELLHTNAKVTKEEAVTQSTLLFTDENGEAISWERGAVAYENFTVKNAGDLALNYRLALDLNNANTIKGTNKSLKDVLKVKVLDRAVTANDLKEDSLKNDQGFKAVAGNQLNILEKAAGNGTQKLAKSTSSAVYGVAAECRDRLSIQPCELSGQGFDWKVCRQDQRRQGQAFDRSGHQPRRNAGDGGVGQQRK